MEEEALSVQVANNARHLTLPLTRYAARLFTRDQPRSEQREEEEEDDDDDDVCGYYNNDSDSDNGNYYYYWYYWKAIMVVDLVWNLGFVVVAVVVLLSSFKERPSTPLRLWLFGYSLQCLFHVAFVYLHFLFRNSSSLSHSSIVKRLESINTMISSIWWVFGFYWIVVGGQALLQDSPRLYWLTVVFLAFDVFFIIFCIGMAFVIFFALCCCIPIVAFAYAMTIKEGASEDDIMSLPKYRFHQANPMGTFDNDRMKVVGARMESGNNNPINELSLHPEDSECCICLSRYVDGVELHTLPCNHHFHCGCISRWLRINATCPLCKYNILQGDTLV